MLDTIYKELKGSFDDIQEQIESFRKDFESNGRGVNKQGIIFGILQNIEFQKFLIYKLNKTDFGFFLKIFEDNFVVELTQLWHLLYPYHRRINRIKSFLRYDQRQILMKKNPNLDLLSSKVNALYVVYLLYINLDFLKEKMIITNLLVNKMNHFLKRTNPQVNKISFYSLINLLQVLYNKDIIKSDLINDFEVEKSEWEIFNQSILCDSQSILFQYYNNPEFYENNLELFYKEKKKVLQEQGLNGQGGVQIINDLKMLITYNNLKKSHENLIKLSFFELFLIKLIYNFDLKNIGGENLQYIIPIYLLHFSKNYKEYKKIKYIFTSNFQIKYLLLILLGSIILLLGSWLTFLSGLIIIFSQKISNFINNITNSKIDFSIPVKIIGITLLIITGINSNYGKYYHNIVSGELYTDIVNQGNSFSEKTNWTNISLPFINNNNSPTVESLNGKTIKIQIDNINDLIGSSTKDRYYYLGDDEKISDIVNSFVPINIKGEDRKEIIQKVTYEYIELNKDYLIGIYKIDESKTKYIDLNNIIGFSPKLDIVMINQLIKQYK
ncbi:MAG: hypothetical protein V3575_03600 [Candidatus Absconditabacteria bacterium]